MQATTVQPARAWIGRVRAMVNCGDSGPGAVARFLPPKNDPDYTATLSQLVLADLRLKQAAGRPSAWADYRSHFPDLPECEPALSIDDFSESECDLTQTPLPASHARTNTTRVKPVDVIDLNPQTAPLPRRGDRFGGFTIVDELGRGAFGRVFLATEHHLADRPVALKVTRKANRESQRLARLQHTNIVPIHNAFELNGWHVLQMPFFGRQTLADLVETVRAEKTFPKVSADVFMSTQMRASTSRKTTPSSTPQSAPGDSKPHAVPAEMMEADHDRQPSRELLAGLSYSDAAIWIVARLADGLAHAHGKGILHLDLKPHNVLLSDDGQPMLLDFNLSFDVDRCERDRVGGTWPYMSPEQICEYARRPGSPVDPRSDLFALGVMFLKLLTLHQPFPPVQSTEAGLIAAVEARQAGAPDVRDFNPNVPPSIAAVVAKLLEPSPLRRYQSADELREDLRRHAEHRPLAVAKDRSVRERVTKWHRRNPRLSLLACIAVLGFGLAFTAAQMMAWSKDRERIAAMAKAGAFRTEQSTLRLDLASQTDVARRERAADKVREWLKDYRVGETNQWSDAAAIRLLPAADQTELRSKLAEAALLAAHAEWLGGRHRPEWERTENYARAQSLLETAKAAFGDDVPASLTILEHELAGRSAEKLAIGENPVDLYAAALRQYAEGEYKAAAGYLVRLTQLTPDHFAGQFMLGNCYEFTGQSLRASERFQVAKPLAPTDGRPAFHRGMILAHLGRLDEAEADFDESLKREVDFSGAHLQRANIRKKRNNSRGAIDDLTAELNLEKGNKIIAYAMRAIVYEGLGEHAAAAADRAAIDKLEPITDLDYVARAARWITSEPLKALADYDRALKINPECYSALQNKAHVFYEQLNQPELALASIKRAATLFPGINKARMGHAVVLARLGKRDEAHKEAEAAILLGFDPVVTYQAACVYALTCEGHDADRVRSHTYLRQCLREGYTNWHGINNDRDLDNIRGDAEFAQAVRAAMDLQR